MVIKPPADTENIKTCLKQDHKKTTSPPLPDGASVPARAPGPLRPLLAGVLTSSEVISFLFPEGPGVLGLPEELRLGVF